MKQQEMKAEKISQKAALAPTPTPQSEAVAPVAPAPQAPIQIPEVLNHQQALQVLVDAARAAQSKGIFSLEDAELVSKAIKAFMPKGPVPSNG